MNQPMDFNAMVQGAILGTAVRMQCMVMLELLFDFLPWERERMRATLDREPTLEDWEDLSQFRGEQALIPRCLQRAADREKIRRLVFGEDNASS